MLNVVSCENCGRFDRPGKLYDSIEKIVRDFVDKGYSNLVIQAPENCSGYIRERTNNLLREQGLDVKPKFIWGDVLEGSEDEVVYRVEDYCSS